MTAIAIKPTERRANGSTDWRKTPPLRSAVITGRNATVEDRILTSAARLRSACVDHHFHGPKAVFSQQIVMTSAAERLERITRPGSLAVDDQAERPSMGFHRSCWQITSRFVRFQIAFPSPPGLRPPVVQSSKSEDQSPPGS